MKEIGSGAFALTAALITSSTFLPRACSSMYSWMDMFSEGADRTGAACCRCLDWRAKGNRGAPKTFGAASMRAEVTTIRPQIRQKKNRKEIRNPSHHQDL